MPDVNSLQESQQPQQLQRRGQCGTCVMEVLEGQGNLSPRSDVEEVYLADRPAYSASAAAPP